MNAEPAALFGHDAAAPAVDDDVIYYTRRIAEERALAEGAASDVARSAHRALALVYEDHLKGLGGSARRIRSNYTRTH